MPNILPTVKNMESFAQTQDVSAADTQETVSVTIRIESSLDERLEKFMKDTVRSKSHTVKFLILKGFELLEQEGVQA